MKTNYFQTLLVAVGIGILTGCASTEKPNVKYIDPGSPGSHAGTGI